MRLLTKKEKYMKKFKQLLGILLLGISIYLLFLFTQSYAATGTITTETIRLRKEASTNSAIVELISKGEEVEIISEEEDWYKVKYKGMKGYVSKEYVKVKGQLESSNSKEEMPKEEEPKKEEATPQPSTEPVTENQEPEPSQQPADIEPVHDSKSEQTNTQSNTKKKVNSTEKLYILPLINYSSIYEITTQDKIQLLQTVNNWSYVEVNGLYGWVIEERLVEAEDVTQVSTQPEEAPKEKEPNQEGNTSEPTNTPEPTSQTKDTQEEQNKIAYIKLEQVNFREEAKTESEVIQTLKQNTKVEVIGTVGDWSKIKYNGKEGYIATKLLSDTKIEVTNRSAKERTVGNLIAEQTTKSEETIKTNEQAKVANTSSKLDNKGSEIVAYAKQFLGCKYVYGGSSPKGFDCSGFTQYVYKHFGYSIARSSSAQSKNGKQVSKSELQLGDLILFTPYSSNKGIGHVGIYIGNNQFIHASSEKTGVITSSLNSSMYQRRYVTARRIL